MAEFCANYFKLLRAPHLLTLSIPLHYLDLKYAALTLFSPLRPPSRMLFPFWPPAFSEPLLLPALLLPNFLPLPPLVSAFPLLYLPPVPEYLLVLLLVLLLEPELALLCTVALNANGPCRSPPVAPNAPLFLAKPEEALLNKCKRLSCTCWPGVVLESPC